MRTRIVQHKDGAFAAQVKCGLFGPWRYVSASYTWHIHEFVIEHCLVKTEEEARANAAEFVRTNCKPTLPRISRVLP